MHDLSWNKQAERAVLGAMMASPKALMDVLDAGLKPAHFEWGSHGVIFNAILAVDGEGKKPDSITVSDKLRQEGSLDTVGGWIYISTLLQELSTTSSAKAHAAIVIEAAATRRLKQAALEIGTIADGDGTADAKMALADQAMSRALEHASEETLDELGEEMADTFKVLEHAHATGERPTGLRTGFTGLDALVNGGAGLRPGQLVVIAARPGQGKSTLAVNIAQNVGHRKHRSLIFSLEMSKQEIGLRLLASLANVPHKALSNAKFTDAEFAEYEKAKAKLKTLPIQVADSGNLTAAGIRARCRRLQRARGLDLVVVDYLQLMEGVGAENRQHDVAALSRALKLLAIELQVPVIAVSQLSRRSESRENKRPQLADLRDSGAIEQDADIVAFIYRDDQYDPNSQSKGIAEIILAKQRSGETGTTKLRFNGARCRFDNLGSERFGGGAADQAAEVFRAV